MINKLKRTRTKQLDYILSDALSPVSPNPRGSTISVMEAPKGSGLLLVPPKPTIRRRSTGGPNDSPSEKRSSPGLEAVKRRVRNHQPAGMLAVYNNTRIHPQLKNSKDALYEVDRFSQNMLHLACFEGELDTVAYLLSKYKDSDLRLRDKNGWTPLHCAASQGYIDICDMLLRRGASPNAQNGSLTSPFAYAVR